MSDDRIDCPRCGESVPATAYCIRCGASLRETGGAAPGRRRGSYAAAPGESVTRVALFSTLLPQLPAADLDAFRIAFAGGLVALVALVAVGAFPVALVGAALLVPALVLIYVYSVDVYEDTPLPVIALTMVWGAAWGIAFGVAIDALSATTPRLGGTGLGGSGVAELLGLGVLVPILATTVMIAGPLILIRDRRFNDVVDGATFGVASAVSFVGAQVIAGSIGLFADGPTPVGEPLPWIARILSIAVALPVVAAGAIGSAVGAFWLRYRAPVRDRAALGVAGRPAVACLLAAALLVATALAAFLPGPIVNVLVQMALAAAALLWLRRVLHLGLLEEAFELEEGPEVVCANCGQPTQRHSFCGNCGISLHALPKTPREAATMTGPADPQELGGPAQAPTPPGARPRVASGDAGTRLGGRTVVIVFGIVLLVILAVAAAVALLVQTPEPPPDCQPGTDCGGPPPPAEVSSITTAAPDPGTRTDPSAAPGPVGIRAGTPWRSSELGYEFEYSDWWKVDSSDGRTADLLFQDEGDAELIVAGVPSSEASPQAYADQWFGELQKWAPDIKADSQAKNEILGPAIGFVDGIGRTYAGSKSGAFGATSPIGISLVTATDGRTTVAIIIVVWDPEVSAHDTWQQYFVRGRAELSLKTFRWES